MTRSTLKAAVSTARAPKPPRARKPPKLAAHDVVSGRIHPGLNGLTFGQISDIHVRTGVVPHRLYTAVEMLNALNPDFVVLTGDYVCLSPKPLPELTRALQGLNRPAYAVLGNHDHWSDVKKVRHALKDAGVHVLTNEHRLLYHRGAPFYLVGVDDSVTRHHDPMKAFRGIPSHATSVVLSHDPKSADFLHPFRPALILSGHTHGGQIFFKKLTPYLSSKIGMKYLSGFFSIEGSVLYVNRGLGAGIPLRFRAPVEVAALTLRSAA